MVEFDLGLYGVVYANLPEQTIQVHEDELLCLLLNSEVLS